MNGLVIGLHLFVVRFNEAGQSCQSLVDLTIAVSLPPAADLNQSVLIKPAFDHRSLLLNAKNLPCLSDWPARPDCCCEPLPNLAPSPLRPAAQVAEQQPTTACEENVRPFLRFVDSQQECLVDCFNDMVKQVNTAIEQHPPELCEEGEGGTYFLCDSQGHRVGVFKPADEDPQADNNPKKKLKKSLEYSDTCSSDSSAESPRVSRKSIPKHEAALREVAAFELDRGFAGVPITRMMKANKSFFNVGDCTNFTTIAPDASISDCNNHDEQDKQGSLQLYVPYEDQSWNLAPYKFSTSDVHRIGIFDIRTFNTDRHGGNILAVKRNEPKNNSFYTLVPIDHGFCFPTSMEEANWEWLYWPQSKKPFDQETLALIQAIDIEEDTKILRRVGLSEDAVRVNQVATLLLKCGAAAGLNLFEIAKLCIRRRFRDTEELSPLEKACAAAEEKFKDLDPDTNECTFWQCLEDELTKLAHKPPPLHRDRTVTM